MEDEVDVTSTFNSDYFTVPRCTTTILGPLRPRHTDDAGSFYQGLTMTVTRAREALVVTTTSGRDFSGLRRCARAINSGSFKEARAQECVLIYSERSRCRFSPFRYSAKPRLRFPPPSFLAAVIRNRSILREYGRKVARD